MVRAAEALDVFDDHQPEAALAICIRARILLTSRKLFPELES